MGHVHVGLEQLIHARADGRVRSAAGPGRGRGGGACLGKGCTVVDQEVWGVCE